MELVFQIVQIFRKKKFWRAAGIIPAAKSFLANSKKAKFRASRFFVSVLSTRTLSIP
jgi:hypothetical protein